MNREYQITLTVKGTFKRRPKRSTVKREAERLLKTLRVKEPWAPAGFDVRSRALVEKIPKAADPKKEAAEARKAEVLAELNEIAADLARCLGNVKKPRVRWRLNRWCDGEGLTRAHVHNEATERFHGAKQKYVLIPKGLVCVNAFWLIDNEEPGFTAPDKWPYLLAHELMHVRLPGGSHNWAIFDVKVAELLQRYGDLKAGKWTPAVRKAPPRPGTAHEPKPDPNRCPLVCKVHKQGCHVKKGARDKTFEPHEHWHMIGNGFKPHTFDGSEAKALPGA